jgi:DNA-directed RNA polymerase specialized sigma24 family protein
MATNSRNGNDGAPVTRTERLLALLVMHNMAEASQTDRALVLSRAGFSNPEIADLLGTTTATVTQSLYSARRASGRKRPGRQPTTKASAEKRSPGTKG